jgi:hypothetical protein
MIKKEKEKKVLIFTFPKLKKKLSIYNCLNRQQLKVPNMCSKKDVPLLPFFNVLGAKWGQKLGKTGGQTGD